MEAHVAQQSRAVEQERWQQQQEAIRLKAQQAAFQEERVITMSKLEEQRTELQQAREHFLKEQQEILAKCYEEQRVVASERAQATLLRKRAEERDERERGKSVQLSEESARVSREREELTRLQEVLEVERKSLQTDREKLEVFAKEIHKRSEEIDQLCKVQYLAM